MSSQMTIELKSDQDAQIVVNAMDSYRRQLELSRQRTLRELQKFEDKYQVSTQHFMDNIAAEDLEGGDIEWVTWAGEADILKGLEKELDVVVHANYQLP